MINPLTELEIVDQKGNLVAEPEDIEKQGDWMRSRLAPQPEGGQIKTPDEIIDDLEWAKHLASRCAGVIRDADKARRAVAREYAIAHGRALRESKGKSAELREADAYEQTVDLRQLLDEVEIAFEFARAVSKSVEQTASAVQTQSKMVAITYGLAGSGRQG